MVIIKIYFYVTFYLIKFQDFNDLYFNCSSHMNEIGNQVLAEIFERKLKEFQLH